MPSDCADSERPIEEGRKLSCSMAACTRAMASAETGPEPDIARDAVDIPTPARTATSFSVATDSPEAYGWDETDCGPIVDRQRPVAPHDAFERACSRMLSRIAAR